MTDQPEPPDLEVTIPIPGGLRVTGDEPYRILVVGEFGGSNGGTLSGPLCDGVVGVNANTFDDVMAAAAPGVGFTMSDPVAGGNAMAEVRLRFDSLRAFSPQALVTQIPAASSLMKVRERIAARLRGQVTDAELAAAVGEFAAADAALSWLVDSIKPSAAGPAASKADVDSLLDQIDLGDGASGGSDEADQSPIGALVSQAAGKGKGARIPAEEASALRRALVELDRRISVWLTAVIHAPQVRQLESAWRGLAFLVSKVDFRKGLRLALLHVPRDAIVERFSALVIDPVFDEGADAPDLVAVDALFGNTASDMEALDGLAQHAASLPAVVVAGVSAGFFGVKHAWQIATLPPMVTMFDQWQFAKWKTLRGRPYAKHLGVVFGRCLLRAPYHADGGTDLDFAFSEKCVAEKDFLWASGSLAAACSVARSVADKGWATTIGGPIHGRIEGLPIGHGGKKGDKQFGPADTELAQDKTEEMGMSGINTVTGLRDTADAVFWNAMTAARPQRADPAALFEVSLPYMLFAGRLSALLWALKPHLEGTAPDKVAAFVTTHVGTWLKLEEDSVAGCVSAQVADAEDDPSSLQLAVTVTPPQTLIPGGVPVVLGYKFPRQ